MAAAVRPVPRMTPPVLVNRLDWGTELMMLAAFSSGVGSGEDSGGLDAVFPLRDEVRGDVREAIPRKLKVMVDWN